MLFSKIVNLFNQRWRI